MELMAKYCVIFNPKVIPKDKKKKKPDICAEVWVKNFNNRTQNKCYEH